MLSQIKKIEEDNYENIHTFLNVNFKEIHILDVRLCDSSKIDISKFQVKKKIETLLFKHLSVSKIIIQMTLNRYRNNEYYKENICQYGDFLQTIDDEGDKDFYSKLLRQLKNEKECQGENLIEIFKSSAAIYLIVYKILQSIENTEICPPYADRKMTDKDGDDERDLKTTIGSESRSSTPSAMDNEDGRLSDNFKSNKQKSDDKLISLTQNLEKSWKCVYCDTPNVCRCACKCVCSVCEGSKLDNEEKDHRKMSFQSRAKERSIEIEKETPKSALQDEDTVFNDDKERFRTTLDKERRSTKVEVVKEKCADHRSSIPQKPNCINRGSDQDKLAGLRHGNKDTESSDNDTRCSGEYVDDDRDGSVRRHQGEGNIRSETAEEAKEKTNCDITPPEERWSCSRCTLLNSFDNDRCTACGADGPHYDKWRCEECTVINKKDCIICPGCDNVNPFMKKCSQCNKKDITTKYSDKCEDCGTKEGLRRVEVRGDISSKRGDDDPRITDSDLRPTVDQWTCDKCSSRNLFDLGKCSACDNPGPHFDKWRCEKCSYYKRRWEYKCEVCEHFQVDRSTIFQSETRLTRQRENRPVRAVKDYRGEYSCKNCGDGMVYDYSKLCWKCRDSRYVCRNEVCEEINDNLEPFCGKCGLKKDSTIYQSFLFDRLVNGRVVRAWRCQTNKCMTLNDASSARCTKCDVLHPLTRECFYCKHVKIAYEPCGVCYKL